jgi:hypothetical protein
MRDIILKILRRRGSAQTRVIKQILEYDYQEKHTIAQVRRRLQQMESESIVESVKDPSNQMFWTLK